MDELPQGLAGAPLTTVNDADGACRHHCPMKRSMLFALAALTTWAAAAAEPPASLTTYRCYLCHADRETRAGPAFEEVAARYRGTPRAVDVIADEIRSGLRTGGPWHMPPHPEVSERDARTMARYILSLKPEPASTK